MRHIAILIGIVGILFLLMGCEPTEPTVYRPAPRVEYDFGAVITRGNHSYIPLNIGGNPADSVEIILGALEAFEKAHPELEIVGWKIEKQQSSYARSARIFGIWVDHRPR